MSAGGGVAARSSRRVFRLVFLALAFLLTVANGIAAMVFVAQLRLTDARVDRALQVIFVLQDVEDIVERSGRDQRTYRLSGDASWLQAYLKEEGQLPEKIARLHDLIADGNGEARRLEDLTRLIDQDHAELQASLAPIRPHFEAGQLPAELMASIARSKAVGTAVDDMQSDQARLLRADLAMVRARDTVMLTTVGLGAFGSIVLIVIILNMLGGDVRRTERLATASTDALLEIEQRFRWIYEQSPLGILLLRQHDQCIVQANPAFCRMLGYTADQTVGRAIVDITHLDDRDLLLQAVSHAHEPGRDIEIRFVTGSAVLAWAHISLTPLSTQDSRPALLLALVEDITREKRVEAELRQAQKMEAIGQLTGGIAHDFNNLLGVIIGNVEYLIDALRDTAEHANLAQEILESALSGADLTRRLLAFARRQTLQPRRIDLNAYLPNHVMIIRRLLGETVQLEVTLAENLWPTRADPSQVGDALLNLAINARDAMPHGGRIRIRTANAHLEMDEQDLEMEPGDYVVLSVADTGTGMPPEILERAVEPFFTTKGPGSGSGLGLSMIFGFAKQSGGHLDIKSELGRGTTVRLYLPRALGAEVEDEGETAEPPMPIGRESVLLVDDNAEIRSVARRHLTSLGYRVREADSGPAAVAILQDGNRFDLLFTDIVMPAGMTGYQLATIAQQVQPGLRVLFTTGYVRPEAMTEQIDARLGPMLRKPYRKLDLATAVREVLEA